ncbi:hypothetical protein [Hahella ganghwensis]|uniref:hypothetical protein n=1 Tax=Hahella ganghwensis TaxID=286420 RepID=UPI000399E25B|nr:hypothetical protein [Hahella ganghwensis]
MSTRDDNFEPDFQNDAQNDDLYNEESGKDVYQAESQSMKKAVRDQLQSDIEAFLQQGGVVQSIEDNVRADPPRKPDLQYGSGSI